MKSSLIALVLALVSPLPYVEAAPTVEEEAVVEMSRSARRTSSLPQRIARVLERPAPPVAAPARPDPAILLRPAPHVDLSLAFIRPPPGR